MPFSPVETAVSLFTEDPLMPIPDIYSPAQWRGTTIADVDGSVGFSLNLPDGSIARYRLDRHSAEQLKDSLAEVLSRHGSYSQSPSSSGMPSSPGLNPIDGQNVAPPAKSSAACSGRS
jgi:hypothetical protein